MVNLSEEKKELLEKVLKNVVKKDADGFAGPETLITVEGCDFDAIWENGLGDATNSEGCGTYLYNVGTYEEPDLRVATYACYDPSIKVEEVAEIIANNEVIYDRDKMIAYLKEKKMSYYDEKLDEYVDNEEEEE